MPNDFRVTVNRYGPGRNLVLRWTDPISGERKAKSSGTTDAKTAERKAGELERKLRAGASLCPGNVTWTKFRERYEAEHLSTLAERTQNAAATAMNHLERVIKPKRLSSLTASVMSRFQSELRKEGMRDTSIAVNLRHLRAGLSWAVSVGMLAKVPTVHVPKRARGKTRRGRPLRLEEAEKMFLVAPKARPQNAGNQFVGIRPPGGSVGPWPQRTVCDDQSLRRTNYHRRRGHQ